MNIHEVAGKDAKEFYPGRTKVGEQKPRFPFSFADKSSAEKLAALKKRYHVALTAGYKGSFESYKNLP